MRALKIVSVIVPTVASRAACVGRALDSVLAQKDVRVDPIVVANGPDCDPDLVDSPYFAELGDDDLLLPGALAARMLGVEMPNVDGQAIQELL